MSRLLHMLLESDSSGTFPVLSTATTADAIRDRMIVCIEAITPTALTSDKFRAHLDEVAFDDFIAAQTAGALRRFEVIPYGAEDDPQLTNCDVEERWQRFMIRVAYPANSRYGATWRARATR